MKTIKLLLTILLLVSISFSQMIRGVSIKVKDRNGEAREIKLYDASYALVIGNGNYKYWDSLNGVKSDVSAVEKALKENGFTVETAMDLDSRSLSQRIGQFVNDYGYEKNNRLLIYYAGHGYTQNSIGDDRELGYIVPVDSPLPSKDRLNFSRTAVDLEEIRTFAKKIQSKHALFLFDSCFSGKLISRGEVIAPSIIEESIAYPVRQFITAGSANQTVPDESIFRRAFIRGLEGEADLNKDDFILGSELASYLRDRVTNYSSRKQTPLYAKIDDINLDRGDFVFVITPKTISISEISEGRPVAIGNSMGSDDKSKPPIKQGNNSASVCNGKNSPLKIISQPLPQYTETARKNHISGEVVLKVTFDSKGEISKVVVAKGLPDGLTEMAIIAAKKTTFAPEIICGVPQTVDKLVLMKFTTY
jgi:TonB family protein